MRSLAAIGVVWQALAAHPAAARQAGELTSLQWREDLAVMVRELEAQHLDLFHDMERADFEAAVRAVHTRIPDLAPHEIIVAFARLTAMIGDGHSGVRLASDPSIRFASAPIRFYWYEDGLFVQRASPAYWDVVGGRVISLGSATPDEAWSLLRDLVPRDNDQYARVYTPFFMAVPEILHAAGISESPREVPLVVERDGERVTTTLRADGVLHLTGETLVDSGMSHIRWVDASDRAAAPTPLWRRRPHDGFWFEYLPEDRVLYVQINEVLDQPDETLRRFAERLFCFVDENEVEKIVYDLRLNRGGNATLIRPLVLGIIRRADLDRRGSFFTVIGRRTFSAAQSLVNELEKYTNVLFVGEPTASRVNFFADNRRIRLPHSGLDIRASYLILQHSHPLDDRSATAPHVAAPLTFDDYRSNRDPALAVIRGYGPEGEERERLSPAASDVGRDSIVVLRRGGM